MNNNTKICLVAHEAGSYKGQGGIATYIELTAKGFISLGYDVSIVHFEGLCDIDGARTFKLENQNSLIENSKLVDNILDSVRPDIVESTDFLGLIHQTLLKRAISGLEYKCRFIINHHTGIREIWEWGTELKFYENRTDWYASVYQIERAQSLLADLNCSTSSFLTSYLKATHKAEDYLCIPSYFPLSSLEDKDFDSYRTDEAKLKILSLGRFELRKKQEILVHSVCDLISRGFDIEVTFIGNSTTNMITNEDYMQYCFELIPRELKTKFKFFDFIPYKKLDKIYSSYDLFVVPSPYENFPNTALEAIKNGLLTCGSHTSGIKDMIGETSHIFCFEKNSALSMSQVIESVAKMSKKERTEQARKQYNNLMGLSSFKNSIIGRIDAYKSVRARYGCYDASFAIEINFNKGKLKGVYFQGEALGLNWFEIRSKAEIASSILITNDRRDLTESKFPVCHANKTVVAQISCDELQAPMTLYDFQFGKVAFQTAYIPFAILNDEIRCVQSFLAYNLLQCTDILEIRNKNFDCEYGLDESVIYNIRKFKNDK